MRARLWQGLDVVLWVAVAVMAASLYAVPAGVAVAALGAACGVAVGPALARTRLRGTALLACCAGVGALGLAMHAALSHGVAVASFLGPGPAYALADVLLWSLVPTAAVALMEAAALRRPALRAAQLICIGIVFAGVFAAHREGFTNRPFFFVDPLWGQGKDPLGYFLLLGAALAALLALTLSKGAPGRRSALGTLTLLVLILALFLALPQGKLKSVVELHRVLGGQEKDRDKDKDRTSAERKERQGRDGSGRKGDRTGNGEGDDDPALPNTFSDSTQGQSNQPVAVVVFHADFKPPLGYYYFRETAFSEYNGVRLVQDPSGRFDRDLAAGFSSGRQVLESAGLPYSAAELPGVKGESFVRVPTTVALLAPHSRPFGLVNPAEITSASNPDPRRFFRAYNVVSSALQAPPRSLMLEAAGGRGWDAETTRHYTAGPTDPRYGELSEKIVSELPEELRGRPFARAVAIKLWLDKHGTYSLTSRHPEGGDPVADFLFGDLTGHCVHFAHAACLLYRAAGIPARVATGYAVRADYMGSGPSLLIREREAHAWPEVCLHDAGWVPLDISPEKSLAPPEEAPDQSLQKMLGGMATKSQPPPTPPPPEERRSLWAMGRAAARALMVLAAALLALAVLACYGVKLWRRWCPSLCAPGRLPLTAYRAALDALSEAGMRRWAGESREAFARRVGTASPAFSNLTACHLRWALGGAGRTIETSPCLPLLEAVRGELASASSRPRRVLRALNPVPWWGVR
jgi:protein-glutamine gamma-glutamyltransferase